MSGGSIAIIVILSLCFAYFMYVIIRSAVEKRKNERAEADDTPNYSDTYKSTAQSSSYREPSRTVTSGSYAQQLKSKIDNTNSASSELRRIADVLIKGNYSIITGNAYTVADFFILTAYLATSLKCQNMREKGHIDEANMYARIAATYALQTVAQFVPEGNEMYQNRMSFYMTAMRGSEINRYYEELSNMLAQDYLNNKYVPWSAHAPLAIYDITTMITIKTEVDSAAAECLNPLIED